MKLWEKYHTPSSIEEAVSLLKHYNGAARIIAGGTDLLVEMRDQGHDPIPALVDITSVKELQHIQQVGDEIIIGAGVTHSQIVQSEVLAARGTCLVESCGVVGGPQVRNVATLGGNVAHALPAGDGTTSLVALDATAEIIKDGKQKTVPIREMYLGPANSLLDPTRDILLRFRFALVGEREGSAFKRIMRPQGVALPILGCAVWVRLNESRERYAAVRICLAPVAATPIRAEAVESALVGMPTDDDAIEKAGFVALQTLHPRTSKYRATADYRQEMIVVLLRRTLPLAVQRARTGQAIPEGVGA
jgi:carbon-monoxide dehydrogenase medium subunit